MPSTTVFLVMVFLKLISDVVFLAMVFLKLISSIPVPAPEYAEDGTSPEKILLSIAETGHHLGRQGTVTEGLVTTTIGSPGE